MPQEKIRTAVGEVMLSTPTFHRTRFSPTLINFFYGKNGSGKSTIARELLNPGAVRMSGERRQGDYEIELYNEDYATGVIRSYGRIPGLFTLSEESAEAKKMRLRLQRELAETDRRIELLTDEREELSSGITMLDEEGRRDNRLSARELIEKYSQAIPDEEKRRRFENSIMNVIGGRALSFPVTYQLARRQLEEKLGQSEYELGRLLNRRKSLELGLKELASNSRGAGNAKDNINRLLREAGFRGFRIESRPGEDNVYYLARSSGECVQGTGSLSEGERHFIAFLYFYQQVLSPPDGGGEMKDKIVIIDDPVTSMDSGALFIVAALTRNLIRICYNNYELSEDGNRSSFIRQFFCLTHNPEFFREVTSGRTGDYECVSLFKVDKDEENVSSVTLCTRPAPGGWEEENFSPAEPRYNGLWRRYCSPETDPEALPGIMRMIIDGYFVQTLGYSVSELRGMISESEEFLNPDGSRDLAGERAAASLLALMDAESGWQFDDLYYVPGTGCAADSKETFRRIFKALKQDQHYERMTAKF